jgi:Bacterial Ig domain
VSASGSLAISATTFTANAAGPGGGGGDGGSVALDGVGGAGGPGGTGANGGAIFSQSGDATLLNPTLVANRAGAGGAGGDGGSGGDGSVGLPGGAGGAGGAGGLGGGLRRQLAGTATVTHATITGNFAGGGGSGGSGGPGGHGSGGFANPGAPGGQGPAGSGGGVSEASGINPDFTIVANSIVASNSGSNCAGTQVQNGGHNVAFGDATCGFPTMDPMLGALQDNGGAVETRAPLAGSPALDQVPASGTGCAATDARGVPRPSPAGGLCDIGAVEISPPSCQPVSAGAVAGQPTQIQLMCTDLAGAPFTFALLSQPARGTLSAFDAATGRVTYTAPAGYAGADSFGFQGTTADGSASAQVALTVTASLGPGATTPPLLSALRVSPRRFRPARRGGSVASARRGTRVSFALDRAASVRFTVARRMLGRRSGRRCVAPTRRNRSAKRCIRFVAVKGSFKRAGRPGVNSFRFTGRMRRRALAPGRYVLRARPTAAGVAGKTVRAAFTILR